MNATKSITSVLNKLIEICKDGQDGFRAASEKIEDHSLKVLLSEYSLERSKFAGELQSLVIGLGEREEKSSGFVSALHRGWIDLKGALSKGDNHAILAECERGEDVAVDAYKEALEDELPAHIHATIQSQYAAVQVAHNHIRDLRDEAAA